MKTLSGRVAVITGAGGGVGAALAQALARAGCKLAMVDINAQSLASAAAVLPAGTDVSRHTVDITSAEQVQTLRDAVVAKHGGVNILINNAGITIQKTFAAHTLADWERMININLWGVIHGCQAFLPDLLAAEEAHIVNLSSMSAFVGLPTQSSYCATKGAVCGLSESLWSELHSKGVGVTSVHPGAIKTDMIQATLQDSEDVEAAQRNYELAQRMGVEPEYVAQRIVTAVRRNQRRIRVGKDAVMIDLLKRFCAPLLHRLLLKANLS